LTRGWNEPLQLHIIVPVLMCCAMLWWVGRHFNWTTRLLVTAITLVVIICVLLIERGGF
jgi:membrane protein CcdC involved in cytochrome C biogenesis